MLHSQNTLGPGFKPRQIGSRVDALSLPVTHSSRVCWEPPWCQALCWVQRVQRKTGYSAFLLGAESGLRVEHINKQSLDLNPTILDPERGTNWWVGICLSDRKEWTGKLFLENWEKPDQTGTSGPKDQFDDTFLGISCFPVFEDFVSSIPKRRAMKMVTWRCQWMQTKQTKNNLTKKPETCSH